MKKFVQKPFNVFFLLSAFSLLFSCSVQKQISNKAKKEILGSSDLASANIGISIFNPTARKFLYNYHAEKNFIPASNTKLFTLYAGMKYLEDSLVAARYKVEDGTLMVQATGDPTFLHPDFKNQPLLNFLQQKEIDKISLITPFASESFGRGWAWDDFKEEYMAERDPFPMYGNLATISFNGDSLQTIPALLKPFVIGAPAKDHVWEIDREIGGHIYTIDTTKGTVGNDKKTTLAMDKGLFASRYLDDTLHKEVIREYNPFAPGEGIPIYSQSKDSLFKIMLHRSDNLYAEQTLLMVSNEKLGEMNDVRIIDTLLATDLKDLPQKPRWVDGSGLSRYNLFSPKDLVWILNKLKEEYSLERLKVMLPGANEGTLKGLFNGYENHIYAKTGSFSNNLALSGYLVTKKNKTLLFSILINNHTASASAIKKRIEMFLEGIIDKY
ncbi:D-alanyl-D-alanine carboxypeptidase/D-alanyl-D-alanine-endopeptidase [Segetibacter koreensis]|uniref:D-alanyl-D-alanine carboxypeptidase/D-alanyl-D-alanine-endopeptidase n=1 Tax=Segetibacter koreensis TaxID=398037 RepID=UPI0003732DF7|nr:D-alanyl-D-alanine carboxypeptidase [Segetibacter koreensis]